VLQLVLQDPFSSLNPRLKAGSRRPGQNRRDLESEPGTSPFDMVDRRQVAYNASAIDAVEDNLCRHVIEALRAGHKLSFTANKAHQL